MKIFRLTASRITDWLAFFDHRAFCDNPALQACYCTYFYSPKQPITDFSQPKTNRDYALQLINAGLLRGYLVYDEKNRVIGWCSVNQKEAFFKIPAMCSNSTTHIPESSVLAIMCFVIDPEHRGKGITTKLVSRIIRDAKKSGITTIEAYPKKKARTPVGAFHGGYSMYKKLGFADSKSDSGTVVFYTIPLAYS